MPLVQGHCCPLSHDWPQLDLGSSTLLVVQELKPEIGVPSEPCTELIPSFFGIVCAILIVWAICHFRSEGTSIVVEVAKDATRDFGQHQAGRQQVPSCAGHGNT